MKRLAISTRAVLARLLPLAGWALFAIVRASPVFVRALFADVTGGTSGRVVLAFRAVVARGQPNPAAADHHFGRGDTT